MKKTSSELIIDTLLSGSALRTPEIRTKLAAAGHKMELSNIASLLRVLSDQDKRNLGYFLIRERTSKGYAYSFVSEVLELSPNQIYGLTRKIGKNSFPINQAIKKIPGLKKYLQPSKKKPVSKLKAELTTSDKESLILEGIKEVILQGGLNFNISCNIQVELPDNLQD